MKNIKYKAVLLFSLVILQLAGCGSNNEYIIEYEEDSWDDNTENEADIDFSEQEVKIPSAVDGNWYIFDTVKRKDDELKKITFKDNIISPAEGYEYDQEISEEMETLAMMYENIPYEYDEQREILTLDYRAAFQKLEEVLEQENDEEGLKDLEKVKQENSGGLLNMYVRFYDDMMFMYSEYSDANEVNEYLVYDNPNFPNSLLFLEKDGKYYTLSSVCCKKAEFPNVRSMSLSLGAETIEGCLCDYYANWVGVLSVGFLEKVYSIYDSDIITVQQEIEEAEFDPDRVDYENLSIENIEDVPMENPVWAFYADCPLEEMKYVTYSHDVDSGRQTSGIYIGKTCGLWSVLWTNGDL